MIGAKSEIPHFNPRSSCEERRESCGKRLHRSLFQSTLLMRGATPTPGQLGSMELISIHAPHARSDTIYT